MRLTEYTWMFNHIVKPPAKVLDVGVTTSYLSFELLKMGLEVHAIDTRYNSSWHWEPWVNPETYKLWEENKTSQKVKFKLGDIRHTDYPSDYFDQIFAISTLEHVGLAAYDNSADDVDAGDFNAMKEILRILKPAGNALVTFGYGVYPWKERGIQARVYDDTRLQRFLEGAKVIEMKIFGNKHDSPYWPEVTKEEAIAIQKDTTYGNEAIVCLKVTKA
jgi:SAM-dependent methyltransferase